MIHLARIVLIRHIKPDENGHEQIMLFLKTGNMHINNPMTHQEFASTFGTTRETVTRLFNQLRKENLLETPRSGFVILDYEALKNWIPK